MADPTCGAKSKRGLDFHTSLSCWPRFFPLQPLLTSWKGEAKEEEADPRGEGAAEDRGLAERVAQELLQQQKNLSATS